MKKTTLLSTIFFAFSLISFSQEQCATPDEVIADPNSITKCVVQDAGGDKKQKKQISIEVSSRKRYVRKNKKAVSSVGGSLNTSDISNSKANLTIGKLEFEDGSAIIEKIPFNLVDQIPLFPKCEKEPLLKQSSCFNKLMAKHVANHFNFPKKALEQGIGGRVLVQFTINETGAVEDIKLRGPVNGQLLEDEAKKIVTELPKLLPGKHNGVPVKVKYGVPIKFTLPKDVKRTNIGTASKGTVIRAVKGKTENISSFVEFANLDEIPLFESCKSNNDKNNCFNERMISHIQRNFNYPAGAVEKNIQGKVWVTFIINKNGEVVNIETKGPSNGFLLEQEAVKMVMKLPKFIPGYKDGNKVNVKYSFPINFKLN
ncbi:energy transducer TonB [Tenacibaculum sp. 190524A02b]|uniref:Periplasmic protein TonB n=1 Tax=Tenacibaculum vairaonense TaxID=3137860 RepID=A0ABM9PGI6_9FLAO